MIQINFPILFASALIPMLVGFVWYHPKVLGTAWMNVCGLSEEKLKGANMPLIFGLAFLFSFFIAMTLQFMVIHQFHIGSILMNQPGINDPKSEIGLYVSDFMSKYGQEFRTFKHGSFHGFLIGLLFVMPIIAINALFERKGFKYIAINTGYFTVSMTLMGGIICAFA
jgi:hypothetical protein